MTIRQLLSLVSVKPDHRILLHDDLLHAVFRCPGMHQVIEEPDQFALTRDDQEFLRQLGICTSF
jgi:hypothetical protein